jgi:CBS domain containing-hemolysin-like protein
MNTGTLFNLGFALFLVLLNGWFVLAEFALVKVRATRMQELVEGGNKKAKLTLSMINKLDGYLSATQLGITLASLGLGWVGEPALARLIEPAVSSIPGASSIAHGIAVAIAFTMITFLHVTLGEMAPKMIGIQRAEQMSLWVSTPLYLFFKVTWPLIFVFQAVANVMVRAIGMKPVNESEMAHSEEELRLIVDASARHGMLDQGTRDLLDKVFEYSVRVAREVMTPRRDVVTLDVNAPKDQQVTLAIEKEYTRYPLIDEDRVVGFVHIKDLVAVSAGRRKVTSLAEVARQPVYIPEQVSIERVRRQLQAKRTHVGIVVDEFGEFTGIVTLEDVLEELVGEIQDELDVEQPKIVRRPDGTTEVDGGLLLAEAERKLSVKLPGDIVVDTLGGYVFTLLGRAPVVGDHVVVGEHRLEVIQVDELRIRRLRLSKVAPPPEAAATPDA